MGKMEQARAKLKEIFGYDSFRPGQESAIAATLSGKDVLAVMPTSAGKSLCYQIPALVMDGVTLVVSPLISLMQDQVTSLIQNGVRAAYLNSSLTAGQIQRALQNAERGMYRIIYIAPERLLTPNFLHFAQQTRIAQLVIDEAHCISQWGQDFRPHYLDIPAFLKNLPSRPPVSAYTATATSTVKEDIQRLLSLHNPVFLQTGFDRPNLRFEVETSEDKDASLISFLKKQEGRFGIVYCATRKSVEETVNMLGKNGVSAVGYHAGLGEKLRQQTQDDFVSDRVQVIVATNAFGMGIDKSNVSFVVHYHMPKDLESYYQEAGRAGRDGEPAQCLLLYQPRDVRLNQFLIEHSQDNSEMDSETQKIVSERARERLRRMTAYATESGCLRRNILSYFGENPEWERCGNCSCCLHAAQERDMRREAAQAISCALSLGRPYGKGIISDILAGKLSAGVKKARLEHHALFGVLKKYTKGEILQLLDKLIAINALEQSVGSYSVLTKGDAAAEILRGDEPVRLRLSQEKEEPEEEIKVHRGRPDTGINEKLFRRLMSLRRRIAEEQHIPQFFIFTGSTIREMVNHRPHNINEMSRIPGVGAVKLERYGERFIREIASYEGEEV